MLSHAQAARACMRLYQRMSKKEADIKQSGLPVLFTHAAVCGRGGTTRVTGSPACSCLTRSACLQHART